MSKKTMRMLYYLAWIVGIIAAAVLIYGIIRELI